MYLTIAVTSVLLGCAATAAAQPPSRFALGPVAQVSHAWFDGHTDGTLTVAGVAASVRVSRAIALDIGFQFESAVGFAIRKRPDLRNLFIRRINREKHDRSARNALPFVNNLATYGRDPNPSVSATHARGHKPGGKENERAANKGKTVAAERGAPADRRKLSPKLSHPPAPNAARIK